MAESSLTKIWILNFIILFNYQVLIL